MASAEVEPSRLSIGRRRRRCTVMQSIKAVVFGEAAYLSGAVPWDVLLILATDLAGAPRSRGVAASCAAMACNGGRGGSRLRYQRRPAAERLHHNRPDAGGAAPDLGGATLRRACCVRECPNGGYQGTGRWCMVCG